MMMIIILHKQYEINVKILIAVVVITNSDSDSIVIVRIATKLMKVFGVRRHNGQDSGSTAGGGVHPVPFPADCAQRVVERPPTESPPQDFRGAAS